jgi:hypothetical protein
VAGGGEVTGAVTRESLVIAARELVVIALLVAFFAWTAIQLIRRR